MPSTPPDSPGPRPSGDRAWASALNLPRRSVLLASGAGLLAFGAAACSAPSDRVAPPPSPTIDERARSRAADQEQRLAELASRTADAHPTITWAAVAGRAHSAHAQALREGLAPSPSADGSSSPGASTSPRASTPASPASPSTAARALAAAELAAGRDHRRALTEAGITNDVARLLASVAASDAAFSRTLRDQAART